jgi:hypothetical protein
MVLKLKRNNHLTMEMVHGPPIEKLHPTHHFNIFNMQKRTIIYINPQI